MIKKIALIVAIVIGLLVVVVLGLASTKPDSFSVQRQLSIKAPPDKIYPLIADFHQWGEWSPWEKIDPAMKRTFSGNAAVKGSVYEWLGNKDVGSGRMEILEPTAPSRLLIKLDFFSPMEGHNLTEFTLAPQGDATAVTWTMTGPSNWMTKVMQVFFSLDKMIGKDFETGLANMKAVAEK
jgi:hypothetical protein